MHNKWLFIEFVVLKYKNTIEATLEQYYAPLIQPSISEQEFDF